MSTCTIETLPVVHPMMVRRFHPGPHGWGHWRDKLFLVDKVDGVETVIEVEEIGLAQSRLSFDEDVVDQSGAVFEFTTDLMLAEAEGKTGDVMFLFFTSRRWREHRYEKPEDKPVPDGFSCDYVGNFEPLLFIGNPYFVGRVDGEITVIREQSYLIKSGMQLQAEREASL